MTDPSTRPSTDATDIPDLQPFLRTAIRAARESARLQRAHQGSELEIDTKSSDTDLVTHVDKLCEARIRDVIAEAHPDHVVLGEEQGQPGDDARHRWIVDPIDGTVNYAHGIPYYCVSVALEIDGVVQVGVVIDSVRDEMFTAVRGGGAWLNGRPIAVSPEADPRKAMLATGFPNPDRDRHPNLDAFVRALPETRAVRRLGAAALDLAYVACGRLDGFWELELNPWDVAAGVLLIEEAGGTATRGDGSPYRLDDPVLIASNGALQGKLVALLELGDALA